MGQEASPVHICPGVDKVWLPGSSGFVYRMGTDYLRSHSPFSYNALVEAGAGIPGFYNDRQRADMLILGPGRYERELLQPVQTVRQSGFGGKQVHVHALDKNPIPADISPIITTLTEENPQIQVTHREGIDIGQLPGVQPFLQYLDQPDRGSMDLYRTVRQAARIHRDSYLSFPIDTVSMQGVADYLSPKELTALLLYLTRVVVPSTLIVRIAYGEIGRSHMEPGDRERFEQSIAVAQQLTRTREYHYIDDREFLPQVITLRMTAGEKAAAHLTPTYPGSYPPVDTLVDFLQSNEGMYGADTAVELWTLPDSRENEEIASVLVTLKHW